MLLHGRPTTQNLLCVCIYIYMLVPHWILLVVEVFVIYMCWMHLLYICLFMAVQDAQNDCMLSFLYMFICLFGIGCMLVVAFVWYAFVVAQNYIYSCCRLCYICLLYVQFMILLLMISLHLSEYATDNDEDEVRQGKTRPVVASEEIYVWSCWVT